MKDYIAELNVAISAVKAAGDFLSSQVDLQIDSQEGKDLKLAADRQSESILIEKLGNTGIPILSEEKGFQGEEHPEGYKWIVDPIDGTVNYYRRLEGLSCVSVALWKGNQPVLGVINRFEQNELYAGIVGNGATLNGVSIKTSGITQVSQGIIATGFPVGRDYSSESLQHFITNVQRFKKVRMLGTAALMGVFVASGQVDAYMEESIMIWDIAASAAIVLAAGGVFNYIPQEGGRCICQLFATKELSEAYNA